MELNLNDDKRNVNGRLEVTDNMKENLLTATKWIKFLNIIGSVGTGFYAFAGFGFFFYGIMSDDHNARASIQGLVFLAVAAIYYPMLKRTFTFIKQARSACKFDDNEEFAGMFDSLKFVARYCGILTVIVLVLLAITLTALILSEFFRTIALT